ncbi:uncharacterized protein LOC117121701 [Anneissia japonica]|uniref:uncharacterized protein LOC117121701 n=1 Tax=Anneissia japonica TaxID=1529436 RepID=UPI0014256AE4|nr:uncharacterized protein LOC117121701 [Anneissia japonica]
MTSRHLVVGSKAKNNKNDGTGGVTILIIGLCLCIFGGSSLIFVIIFFVIKKKQVANSTPVKSATNRHSSNATGLDFDNPAYKIYVLEEIDKESTTAKHISDVFISDSKL